MDEAVWDIDPDGPMKEANWRFSGTPHCYSKTGNSSVDSYWPSYLKAGSLPKRAINVNNEMPRTARAMFLTASILQIRCKFKTMTGGRRSIDENSPNFELSITVLTRPLAHE